MNAENADEACMPCQSAPSELVRVLCLNPQNPRGVPLRSGRPDAAEHEGAAQELDGSQALVEQEDGA